MRFEIAFHTPFRVASGRAGDGSDTTVDRAALLPASSLKGVMRSAARDLLKFPAALVEAVFGTARHPVALGLVGRPRAGRGRELPASGRGPASRSSAETGTVAEGALLIADEVLAVRGEFTIDRTGWIKPGDEGTQETVLLAAARAVTAIGGDRRRGLGWVTITPVDPPWSTAHRGQLPLWPGPRPGYRGRPDAGGDRWLSRGMLPVSVTARQRLALGTGSEVSFFTGSHSFVPGSVLRGALAAAWIAEHGPPARAAASGAEFRDLFDGPVRYGPLYLPGIVLAAGLGAAVQVPRGQHLRGAGRRRGVRARA